MADRNTKQKFDTFVHDFYELNVEKIFREQNGSLSLIELKPLFERVSESLDLTNKYAFQIGNAQLNQIGGALKGITQQAQAVINLDDSQFVAQRDDYLRGVTREVEAFFQQMDPVNLLDLKEKVNELNSGNKADLEELVQDHLGKVQESVSKELDELRRSTKVESESILAAARDSAEGVSVSVAQDQFSDAVGRFDSRVRFWSYGSALSIAILIGSIYWLANTIPDINDLAAVSKFAIWRIGLFVVVAGLSRYSFSMLRTNMHLRETNAHRARLTNSISAFTAAAQDGEQKSIVLGKLVEAVSADYESGFLSRKTSGAAETKMSVENVVREATRRGQPAD